MTTYFPIRYQGRIEYPTLAQAKAYTESYRTQFMDRENPDKGWYKFTHSPQVEALVIGGMNKYFLVYAYPPAGFEIACLDDVPGYELWRGFILELLNTAPTYRLDMATYREGYIRFRARKVELGY